MKTLSRRSIYIILFLPIFACTKTDSIFTEIKKDGSATRTFTESADSAFMMGDSSSSIFPFLLDSSWRVTWQVNENELHNNWPLDSWPFDSVFSNRRLFTVHASKHFKDAAGLHRQIWFDNINWDTIRPDVTFHKKFRWFYTYFEFIETFPKINPLPNIPVEKYLTRDEARMWLQGDDNYYQGLSGMGLKENLDHIEKQMDQWIAESFFEEYFQVILNNFHLLTDTSIKKAHFQAQRDTIFQMHKKKDISFEFSSELLDSLYQTEVFTMFFKNEIIENQLEERLGFIDYYEHAFNYYLLMPGEVIAANAREISGDTLFWKLDAYPFTLEDYSIFATSKHLNKGMVILSFVLLLLLVLGFIRYSKNR